MITGPSGRRYDPLPIDNTAGLPQRFTLLRDRIRYEFTIYADVPEAALGPLDEVMQLPDADRFLVVRADAVTAEGARRTVFLSKVVPSLEYRAGALMLVFPTQAVARRNLNGTGMFGTNIVGGVASP